MIQMLFSILLAQGVQHTDALNTVAEALKLSQSLMFFAAIILNIGVTFATTKVTVKNMAKDVDELKKAEQLRQSNAISYENRLSTIESKLDFLIKSFFSKNQ